MVLQVAQVPEELQAHLVKVKLVVPQVLQDHQVLQVQAVPQVYLV